MLRIVQTAVAILMFVATGLGAYRSQGNTDTQFQLAYLSNVPPGNVCLVNMDGTGQRCLSQSDVDMIYYEPQWSPDGSILAYMTARRPIGPSDISTTFMHYFMTGETLEVAGSWWISSWSPDGQYVLSATKGNDAPGIVRIQPDGSDLIALTTNINSDYRPAWSPDGKYIAYLSLQTENHLMLMNANGSNQQTLVSNLRLNGDVTPQWSPDSQQIVFAVHGRTIRGEWTSDLYNVIIDGTGLTRLTSTNVVNSYPRWSPDSTRIVFQGYSLDDQTQIHESTVFSLDLVDPQITDLTDTLPGSGEPSWSPDGEWIAFSGEQSGTFGIYIMRPDGSDVRLVTDQPAQAGYGPYAPVWRPVPSAGNS
jgi:TolB protein